MRVREWAAGLLVTYGVSLMIDGGIRLNWMYVVGLALLTCGVQLAIDCGKAGA